jgi:hypothetical protein
MRIGRITKRAIELSLRRLILKFFTQPITENLSPAEWTRSDHQSTASLTKDCARFSFRSIEPDLLISKNLAINVSTAAAR